MSITNWGLLTKSATDSETIEEAIARLIQAHDDDEESHLETGQSLQSHKASDIIDHLADSIIADKIARFSVGLSNFFSDRSFLVSAFESLDGWEQDSNGLGSVSQTLFCVFLKTGVVSGDYRSLYVECANFAGVFNYDDDLVFQTTFEPTEATSQTIFLTLGNPDAEDRYVGFKVADDTLYAVARNYDDETSVELQSIAVDTRYSLRVELLPATNKALFYVNQTLVGEITTNLPTGHTEFGPFYKIETGTSAYRSMEVFDVLVSTKIGQPA
jgi:hypothetical protein